MLGRDVLWPVVLRIKQLGAYISGGLLALVRTFQSMQNLARVLLVVLPVYLAGTNSASTEERPI